ncbi:DNA repair protein RecO [soil metagenome]
MMTHSTNDDGEDSPRADHRTRLYNARGIILRRRDLGEADRIVTVYTNEFGKRSLAARGSRKTTSRIAGQLEPFSLVQLFVARTRGLHIISQVQAVEVFQRMRANEVAITVSGMFAELVDWMTPEDQPNSGVFDLLQASLTLLDSDRDPGLITIAFEIGLLRHLGYRPELYRCGVCGNELQPGENGFSLETGVVCLNCRSNAPSVLPITLDALKLLRAIDRGQLSALLDLKINPTVLTEADSILTVYIQRITGKESRARQVFRDLRLQ